MQVKISQAIRMTSAYLKANLVPMIIGSPAIGKSSIVHQLANDNNLKVIDLRLAQCDPTDLGGFPSTYTDANGNKRAGYIPMDTFPIRGDSLPIKTKSKPGYAKGDTLPDGTTAQQDIAPVPAEYYNGWMLFLDEANSCAQAVQAAAYKIILDRMVGQTHLHDKVFIVAAGNLETDNAIVNELSSALKSRLVHMELKVDLDEFLEYAFAKGFSPLITSYLRFKSEHIYNFDPDSKDSTYASPRTWEFANRALQHMDITGIDAIGIMQGILGTGVGTEFTQFCRMSADSLPKMSDIIAFPDTTPIPQEISTIWSLIGAISQAATPQTITPLVTYVSCLPIEHQVICLRDMIRRHNALMVEPAIQNWVNTNSTLLF